MIQPPSRSQIFLAAGITDMRKGMPGLAALTTVQIGFAVGVPRS